MQLLFFPDQGSLRTKLLQQAQSENDIVPWHYVKLAG